MKMPLFRRLSFAFILTISGLVIAGCNSNSAIAPNWYDSAFYKDGSLVTENSSTNGLTAEPGNR